MVMTGYIILGAVILAAALLVIYIVYTYNQMVKRRNRVETQWAQVDVQLTRRADLIPNLVTAVKGYASHEKGIFEKVAAARTALDGASFPGQALAANDNLSGQLSRLFMVAEAYPDLKADKGFLILQAGLKETEDKIAYARQFYNDTVLMYKDKIHQFPANIMAKLFGFKDETYYIADEDKKGGIRIQT